jgi:hypothetical protein
MIFLAGSAELLLAAVKILSIGYDPKNAFIFGFSFQRLALFSLTVCLSLFTIILAWRIYKSSIHSKLIKNIYSKNTRLFATLACFFALFGGMIAVCPPSFLSIYAAMFERIRPILVVIAIFPIQLLTRWFRYDLFRRTQIHPRSFLLILSILLGLILFTATTRLGITHDEFYWNVAGMPVTLFQILFILAFGVLTYAAWLSLESRMTPNRMPYLDILVALGLFLAAVIAWSTTPMVKHFVSMQPRAPYNQPFPFADAQTHDLGAIAILKGWGINGGEYTDKPVYMIFLAILHLFSGLDYNLLVQLQVICLSVLPALLYYFGKSFHSRLLGIMMALLIIIRQSNAISLSHLVASTNPRLLVTEIPTMVALVLFIWVCFSWLRKPEGTPWKALVSGGVLGLASLIRMNPIMLVPAIPFISFFSMGKPRKAWLTQSAIFLGAFTIMIIPWIISGVNQQGQPYFFIKFYDVVNSRYRTDGVFPGRSPEVASTIFRPPSAIYPIKTLPGQPEPLINTNDFPGFVINHSLHNLIETFLALPDSVLPEDQLLTNLATRAYWSEKQDWNGEITLTQIPFLIFSLCLFSIGLAWSWQRWRWAGLLPLFLLLAYFGSLGLARNSGSRYLVPMDWVVFLYYLLGILASLRYVARFFEITFPLTPAQENLNNSHSNKKIHLIVFSALLIIALSIPVAHFLIPGEKTLCAGNPILPSLSNNPLIKANPKLRYLLGEVHYPELVGRKLTFTLLLCKQAFPYTLEGFRESVQNGQLIYAGLTQARKNPSLNLMFSLETDPPFVMWSNR